MDEDDGEALNRRSSGHDLESASKRRRIGSAADDIIEHFADEGDASIGEEIIMGDMVFKPLYIVSAWKEPGSMTYCVSVAVCLPSGVGRGDYSFRVVEEGAFLEVSVTWPADLTNVLLLRRKWLATEGSGGLERYHPKILGFESALKDLRKKSSDDVVSTTRIPLPFPVQAGIFAKSNLGWNCNDSMVFYADLKAAVDDYAVVNDDEAFEKV